MKFEPFVAYEASAGSGKTFQLTVRYLSLLFLDQSPQSILCVTFTKKAAAQMRERIIDALTNLEPLMIEMISNESGLLVDEIVQKKESVLHKFISSNSNILNIDKFFTKILHSFSYEADLDPNFQVCSELDKESLIDNFLKNIDNLDSFVELFLLQSNSLQGIMSLFDTFYEVDPLLPKVEYNDSLQELEAKVIHNFEALKSQIYNCKEASNQLKGFMQYNCIDEIATKSFLQKDSLSEHKNFKKCFNDLQDKIFIQLKDSLKNYHDAKEKYLLSTLLHFYNLYKGARNNRFKLQFNDITQKVFALLYGIDKDFLYFRLDTRYKHILIDEFQDTSLVQFYIFKPLIDEITSGLGQDDFRSFFYVGDVKQSIYRFRGGYKSLFYEVSNLYNIKLKQMDKNFRSTKSVVNFVNQHFDFMKGFTPQKAIKDGGFVSVELIEDEILENIESKIKLLFEKGVVPSDICILTFKNKDAQEIETYLRQKNYDISTENSSKLRANIKVASLLCGLRYLIYKEPLDKEAFFYYTNEESQEIEIDFHPSQQPFEVLSKLIERYNYFNGDVNIIMLLEYSLSYSDIVEFLEENIDESAINEGNSGIKLMTIHKSKGLEFKNCIIVDMLGKDRADTNKIIINNDGLNIESLTYKFPKRSFYDKEYESLLLTQEKLKNEDLEHLLYVGFTRAQENLFVLAKQNNSKINHLNIKPTTIGELKATSSTHKKEIKNIQTITYKAIPTQENKKSEVITTHNFEATMYGTALHYCMEQLESFDPKGLDIAIEATNNRFGNIVDTKNIYNRVKELFNNTKFKDMTDGILMKEKPIIDNEKIKQIDMLIKLKNSYTIIDYKTSDKNKAKDQAQVKEYIAIINRLTNTKTNGAIVYILDKNVSIEEV